MRVAFFLTKKVLFVSYFDTTYYFLCNEIPYFSVKGVYKVNNRIMKELQCPNCGSAFVVDEADYASIVNQVKNAEFQEELNRRVEVLHKQHIAEQKAGVLEVEMSFNEKLGAIHKVLTEKEAEIAQDDQNLKIPVLRGECAKHFVMITICLEKNKEQVQDRYVRIYATNDPEVFNFKF